MNSVPTDRTCTCKYKCFAALLLAELKKMELCMSRPYASHRAIGTDDDVFVDKAFLILLSFCLISCLWCTFSAQVDLCLHFYCYSYCYNR